MLDILVMTSNGSESNSTIYDYNPHVVPWVIIGPLPQPKRHYSGYGWAGNYFFKT